MELFNEKYRIIRELGRGGEGTVYLVRHIVTEQLRAAKVLKDLHGRRKFQEIQAMKHLEHPSLPQIYDVIEENGQIWLIMEYVRGKCLQEIPKNAVTMEQFYSIAEQLADVLVYLHGREMPVYHLDIKPSNVLLKEEGRLLLIDFGAALRKDALEENPICFGTPGFSAPEQVKDGIINERCDIFGAGAVLYYYLFRAAPEKGGVLAAQIRQRWIPDFLGKSIAKIPEQRFQNAVILQKEIRRAKQKFERRRKLGGLAAAMVLLLCVSIFAADQILVSEKKTLAQLREEQEVQNKQYLQLLDQADQLGFDSALECYEDARKLAQGDGEWALDLLERMTEDYLFSLEEENVLKSILFQMDQNQQQSVLQHLETEAEQYEEFAYKVGIAYWHYYEGSGGKRAATEWFSQAVYGKKQEKESHAMEDTWIQRAKIYAKISSYYTRLGRKDENGVEQASIVTYWKDLRQLWKLNDREKEVSSIQVHLAEELVSCILFHGNELKESEVEERELKQILTEVKDFSEKNKMETLKQSCLDAEEALNRVLKKEKQEEDSGEKGE